MLGHSTRREGDENVILMVFRVLLTFVAHPCPSLAPRGRASAATLKLQCTRLYLAVPCQICSAFPVDGVGRISNGVSFLAVSQCRSS